MDGWMVPRRPPLLLTGDFIYEGFPTPIIPLADSQLVLWKSGSRAVAGRAGELRCAARTEIYIRSNARRAFTLCRDATIIQLLDTASATTVAHPPETEPVLRFLVIQSGLGWRPGRQLGPSGPAHKAKTDPSSAVRRASPPSL